MSLSSLNTPDHDAHLSLHLHHASAIRASPALAEAMRTFVNEGYRYMSEESKSRWDYIYGERLPTTESLYDVVGEEGMFAVLYLYASDDGSKVAHVNWNGNGDRKGERGVGTPVACAATKRWAGDLEGHTGREGDEDGWEILCVTTRSDFMRRGHAGTCIDALVDEMRRQVWCGGSRKLVVWTQAVEELNGRFWRNRGWVTVRNYEKPVGHWGSKCGYRLLVLVREFEVGEGIS